MSSVRGSSSFNTTSSLLNKMLTLKQFLLNYIYLITSVCEVLTGLREG